MGMSEWIGLVECGGAVRYILSTTHQTQSFRTLPILHSVIADGVLQQAFAAATGNFQPFSSLISLHI